MKRVNLSAIELTLIPGFRRPNLVLRNVLGRALPSTSLTQVPKKPGPPSLLVGKVLLFEFLLALPAFFFLALPNSRPELNFPCPTPPKATPFRPGSATVYTKQTKAPGRRWILPSPYVTCPSRRHVVSA